eukprot:1090394-Prymnesium_polylepis.1
MQRSRQPRTWTLASNLSAMRARHVSALLDHALALRGLQERKWCAAPPHHEPSRPRPAVRAIWPWILAPLPGNCGGLAE